MLIASRCAENPCVRNPIRQTKARNEIVLSIEEAGAKGLLPLSPAPPIPPQPGSASLPTSSLYEYPHGFCVIGTRVLKIGWVSQKACGARLLLDKLIPGAHNRGVSEVKASHF